MPWCCKKKKNTNKSQNLHLTQIPPRSNISNLILWNKSRGNGYFSGLCQTDPGKLLSTRSNPIGLCLKYWVLKKSNLFQFENHFSTIYFYQVKYLPVCVKNVDSDIFFLKQCPEAYATVASAEVWTGGAFSRRQNVQTHKPFTHRKPSQIQRNKA